LIEFELELEPSEFTAELVPEIIYFFFFYFRLESVAVVIADGLEDPLDDVGMVTQQLDQISGELKFFKIFKFRMPGIESR
jgi:hypothetical protein